MSEPDQNKINPILIEMKHISSPLEHYLTIKHILITTSASVQIYKHNQYYKNLLFCFVKQSVIYVYAKTLITVMQKNPDHFAVFVALI